MTEPTREEKCRVIAEWLGWTYWAHGDIHIHGELCAPGEATEDGKDFCEKYGKTRQPLLTMPERFNSNLPDFYTDEAASALCLERLRTIAEASHSTCGLLWSGWPGSEGWTVSIPGRPAWSGPRREDRKTAIAEAVYQCAMKKSQ